MYDTIHTMNTAQIILSQIKTLDPRALFAWGAKDLVAFPDGLQFKSSGMVSKHKGHVKITLNGSDLYDIQAFTIRAGVVRIKTTVNDVYAEDLISILDDIIG